METFYEFLNESRDGIEVGNIVGTMIKGGDKSKRYKAGDTIYKTIKGTHTINHKEVSKIPCVIQKIEKKKKDGQFKFWISTKSTDDHKKESYFYGWSDEFEVE